MNYKNWQAKHGKPPTYRSSIRWDGGTDPHTKRKYSCIWFELAHFVLSKKIEPEALVRSQFEYQQLNAHPTPTDLRSEKGLARYHHYRRNIAPRLKQQLELEKVAARMAIARASMLYEDTDTMYAAVILDKKLQISPLFRYCLAVERKLPTPAERWKQLALEQYLGEPKLYDQVWGNFIPEGLRDQADSLSNSIDVIDAKGIGDERTISSDLLPAEEVWLEANPYFIAGTLR